VRRVFVYVEVGEVLLRVGATYFSLIDLKSFLVIKLKFPRILEISSLLLAIAYDSCL
jgi:hypothetical protein